MKAKRIGKLGGWVIGSFMLLMALVTGLVYFYQDKVIGLFVAEVNQHLQTRVQVGKMSLSWFDKFPQVSVTLDQVQIMESVPGSQAPLATAEKIYCTFSLLDILGKKYQVRELFMENGAIHVKVLPSGEINYRIFHQQDTAAATNQKLSFNLQKIALRNVLVTYHDQVLQQYDKIRASQVQAALRVDDSEVQIQGEGEAYVYTVRLRENEYFKNKATKISSSLRLNLATKEIWLAPSRVQVQQASYEVGGRINYRQSIYYDLKFKGQNTSVQSVVALLPEKYYQMYGQYRSRGTVYFNGAVKGYLSATETPLVNINFGCRNATFYQPQSQHQITNLHLTGSFTNGPGHTSATSVLALQNLRARLAGQPVAGSLVYRNFDNPYLALKVKGNLSIAPVLALFPVAGIKSGSGLAAVDVSFVGPLKLFRTTGSRAAVQAAGDITLRQVNLQLYHYRPTFRHLSGNFLIRKNSVAVSDFRGWLGRSDFKVNGYFKNALSWLFLKNQSLHIEADLESGYVNGDQLLSGGVGPKRRLHPAGPDNYRFRVSPYLSFEVNAAVRHLQFRRFRAKNIRGNLQLQRQLISSPQIAMQVAGGQFSVQGQVNARSPENIKITTTASLANMQVDSLFYEFENFGQQFIVQRHLKGVLTAHINSDLYFNSYLQAKTDQVEAEIKAVVRNGQLLNFEPLQKLSRFLKRDELANIRFAELSNNFWIQQRTVFIPEMEIRTDVTRASVIGVQGTHTFDQEMDYKFRIPLIFRKARLPETARLPVMVAAGPPNIYLTLQGNENDYKVALDKSRVKNNMALSRQPGPEVLPEKPANPEKAASRQKVVLKDVLKKKEPAKKETVEPEENEYFDF